MHYQRLPASQDTPALNDAQSYLDVQVLQLIERNLDSYFGALDSARRQRYFELANQVSDRNKRLTASLVDCMQAFDEVGMNKLERALAKLSTTPVDPRAWYFHTRITVVPSRQPRALDTREPQERIQSFTLWEAARLDLSNAFPPSYQNRYLPHSYISRYANGTAERPEVISAEAFQRHAHALDLGTDLTKLVEGVMNGAFKRQLTEYHQALFELAILDVARLAPDGDDTRQWLASVPATFDATTQPWTQHQLSFSGNSLPLPFFTRVFPGLDGDRVLSYFPNRSSGALQRHFSQQQATEALLEQIKSAPNEKWFFDGLDQQAQKTLFTHLGTPVAKRDGLNWDHRLLYDLLGQGVTPKEKLTITASDRPRTLKQALTHLHIERFKTDLLAHAVTVSQRQWKALSDTAGIVLGETLGLLTLALPGGVLGANRLMLSATLGSLAYQLVTAGAALRDGERAEAIQALADTSDLIISGRLQATAGKVSRRRARELIRALNGPGVVRRKGQDVLDWRNVLGRNEGPSPTQMDVSSLSDGQLLQRLAARQLPTLQTARAERLLALAETSRSTLESIWYAQATTPWQLLDVLSKEQAGFDLGLPADTGALSQRFPSLSAAARAHLYRYHPALRTLAVDTLLSREQLQDILHVQTEQRVLNAVHAFRSSDQPLDGDSEALFCSMLLADPAWPVGLGIDVHHGGTAPDGLVLPGVQRLASHGLDDAKTFITLHRTDSRYAGSLDGGELAQVERGQRGLAQALLRTLDDAQRTALGFEIHEAAKLIEHVERIALAQRAVLADLLPEPDHYPLSETRLMPLRQGTLPATAKAGEDGIYRLEKKLYITIEGHCYLVLQDNDASSPQRAVWRIVRAEDAVAQAADNVYVATRPGRSEAVARDARGNWQGVLLPGAGGGPKKPSRLEAMRAANQKARETQQHREDLEYLDLDEKNEAIVKRLETFLKEYPVIDSLSKVPGVGRERAIQKFIAHVDDIEAQLILFNENPRFVEMHIGRDLNDKICTQRLEQLKQLRNVLMLHELEMGDALKAAGMDPDRHFNLQEVLDAPQAAEQHRLINHERLANLVKRLPLAARYNQILQKLRDNQAYDEKQHSPSWEIIPDTEIMSGIIQVRSQLLASSDPVDVRTPAVLHAEANNLCRALLEESYLYNYLCETPATRRFELFSWLQQRFEVLAHSLEQLKPDFPEHAADRNAEHLSELLKITNDYRIDCDTRLLEMLEKDKVAPLPSTELLDIDFDFIPAQGALPSASQAPERRRVITVKRHGRSRLVQAKQQGENADRLTLISSDDQATPLEISRTGQGTWQITPVPVKRNLAQLDTTTHSRLEASPKLMRDATTQASRQDAVVADIYEPLLNHADELDILVTQYDQHNALKPLDSTRSGLRQRLIDTSAELHRLADELTLRVYMNPREPNASYLTNLVDKQAVTVRKVQEARQSVGKGKDRRFMDNYLIMDSSGKPLWEAHFHYPALDTPREHYAYRSGHLKTLEDAHKGIRVQKEQERLGRKVQKILRVEVPLPLALSLFELADQQQRRAHVAD